MLVHILGVVSIWVVVRFRDVEDTSWKTRWWTLASQLVYQTGSHSKNKWELFPSSAGEPHFFPHLIFYPLHLILISFWGGLSLASPAGMRWMVQMMHHVTESEKASVPPVLQDWTNKSHNFTAGFRGNVIFAEKHSTDTLHVSIHYWKYNPADPFDSNFDAAMAKNIYNWLTSVGIHNEASADTCCLEARSYTRTHVRHTRVTANRE